MGGQGSCQAVHFEHSWPNTARGGPLCCKHFCHTPTTVGVWHTLVSTTPWNPRRTLGFAAQRQHGASRATKLRRRCYFGPGCVRGRARQIRGHEITDESRSRRQLAARPSETTSATTILAILDEPCKSTVHSKLNKVENTQIIIAFVPHSALHLRPMREVGGLF